jgi:hypothetical protein
MVRLAFRDAVGVLTAAALATACLDGGQTGQPSAASCDPPTWLKPGGSWHGSTVRGAAQAFDGIYSAGLEWREEPRSSTIQTPVDFVDSVQLTITYSNENATRTCGDQLSVPVSVSLSSSASSLVESGIGTLTIAASSRSPSAALHFESQRVRLDATLTPPEARGSLDALDLALPGASAIFPKGQ